MIERPEAICLIVSPTSRSPSPSRADPGQGGALRDMPGDVAQRRGTAAAGEAEPDDLDGSVDATAVIDLIPIPRGGPQRLRAGIGLRLEVGRVGRLGRTRGLRPSVDRYVSPRSAPMAHPVARRSVR